MIMKNNPVRDHRFKQQIACQLLLVIFSVAASAFGEGFRNSTIGAEDLGRSGGRIAQVDDASAVQNNPANLIGVTNTQAQLTPSVIYMKVDYQSPFGQSASTFNPWKVVPNFFVAMPIKDDRYAAGLGVTMPYGLASQWNPGSTAFSQLPPYGSLTYFAPNSSHSPPSMSIPLPPSS